MEENNEYTPLLEPIDKPNFYRNVTISSITNVVEQSAENVIVNGLDNYVGEGCNNINIFASSGCIVSSGVTNCTIIASSGITGSSNEIWVSNTNYTNNVPSPLVSEALLINANYTATYSDEFMIINTAGVTITLPSYLSGINPNKTFIIKNVSGGDCYINYASGFDLDGAATSITSYDGESYTLRTYYNSYFII